MRIEPLAREEKGLAREPDKGRGEEGGEEAAAEAEADDAEAEADEEEGGAPAAARFVFLVGAIVAGVLSVQGRNVRGTFFGGARTQTYFWWRKVGLMSVPNSAVKKGRLVRVRVWLQRRRRPRS